jgi:polar amino acid transport system substrate-binding protein
MVNVSVRASIFVATLVMLLPFLNGSTLGAAMDAPRAPNFSDPALRLDKPELMGIRAIRFLTNDDYTPLNFALPDGNLTGLNVEIARAVCKELEIGCTIQARRFDTLIDSLVSGKGDAVVASIAATVASRARVDFSEPYYQTPARFVVQKAAASLVANESGLKGRTVGVVVGSAHEAYVKAFFPGAKAKPYPDVSALQTALRSREIDAAFADGLTMSVWLNSEASADCCTFSGGPYCENLFFGEGVGIAVRTNDNELRRALNWALARLYSKGIYSEIYFKYFPIGFY